MQRDSIPVVVAQHAEMAAQLHLQRCVLLEAPHIKLEQLRRTDERLAAHLDGLDVAGEHGASACDAALETPDAHVMFCALVGAIVSGDAERLDRLLLLANAAADTRPGVIAAFAWLEAPQLRGVVVSLLASKDAFRRWVGVAASAAHRVDPGLISAARLQDADASVRARALRAAGELGRRELVSSLAAAIGDEDPECAFWAAWSAVVLGDRHDALDFLQAIARAEGPHRRRALRLVLQALPVTDAHALLRQLSQDPANVRTLIQGAGLIGDPTYVGWLIGHMADDELSRVAGEAFSTITGADLAWLDLERKPPEEPAAGPDDDPDNADVDMDEDDGLPWPDPARISAWWGQQRMRFTAGARSFLGAPVTRARCIDALGHGFQRQRIAAAYHLCLSNPGTPLFEWRAPAPRQLRELARLD